MPPPVGCEGPRTTTNTMKPTRQAPAAAATHLKTRSPPLPVPTVVDGLRHGHVRGVPAESAQPPGSIAVRLASKPPPPWSCHRDRCRVRSAPRSRPDPSPGTSPFRLPLGRVDRLTHAPPGRPRLGIFVDQVPPRRDGDCREDRPLEGVEPADPLPPSARLACHQVAAAQAATTTRSSPWSSSARGESHCFIAWPAATGRRRCRRTPGRRRSSSRSARAPGRPAPQSGRPRPRCRPWAQA